MTCRRAHRLLAAYRRDDWSPRDRAVLGQHLSTCPACRRAEVSYRGVGESIRQLPSITPPPGFRESVFAAIRADEQRMRRAVATLTEADTSPELPVIATAKRPASLSAARKRRAVWMNPRVALVAAAAVVVLGLLSIQVLPHSDLEQFAASLGAAHANNHKSATLSVAQYVPDAHVHTVTRALATTGWLVYSATDRSGATTVYAEDRQTKAVVPLAHGSTNAPVMLRAVTQGWAFWSTGSDSSTWTLYASRLGGENNTATALLQSGASADAPAELNGIWANDHLALVAVTTHAGMGKVLRFALPATDTTPVTVAQTNVHGHALDNPSMEGSSIYWAEEWRAGGVQHSLIWVRDASGQVRRMSPDDTAFAPHVVYGLMVWVEGQRGTLEAQSLTNSQQKWVVAQSVDSDSVRVAGPTILWRAGGVQHSWDARTHTSSALETQIRTAAWVEANDMSIVWAGPGGSIEVYDI